jgi:hypothetical protein
LLQNEILFYQKNIQNKNEKKPPQINLDEKLNHLKELNEEITLMKASLLKKGIYNFEINQDEIIEIRFKGEIGKLKNAESKRNKT